MTERITGTAIIDKRDLFMLVLMAYKHEEISRTKAAEFLGIPATLACRIFDEGPVGVEMPGWSDVSVECLHCGNKWVGVCREDTDTSKLECSNCRKEPFKTKETP